jgi:SNF2 family DNA or RNA helicase
MPTRQTLENFKLETLSKAEDSLSPVFDSISLGKSLRPFQRAGVAYALEARRAMIADEMGVGKTIQAIATLEAADAYPAIVICPATIKIHWEREIQKWVPHRSLEVLHGKNAHDRECNADILVLNYELLDSRLHQLSKVRFQSIVFDESHYLKNYKSKRSKAALTLTHVNNNASVILCLTGTPILNRPADLVHQLEILGTMEKFGGRWTFLQRYCGATEMPWGWDVSGATNLAELNTKLRQTCFIRRMKNQILEDLPAKQRSFVPISIDNLKEYQKVFHSLTAWFQSKIEKDPTFLTSIKYLSEEERNDVLEQRLENDLARAHRAASLVRINALRQIVVRGKLRSIEQWVCDFLNSGEKLVLFGGFKDTQRSIYNALVKRGYDTRKIFAEDSMRDRQTAIDYFQNENNAQAIVCSLKAAGHGIELTTASNVCFMDVGWTAAEMEQAEDRCHRMGQLKSVNVWYLIAHSTIEMDILDLIEAKRRIIDSTVNTDNTGDGRLLDELVNRLLKS